VCLHKEQYPNASQQNIANYFSLFCGVNPSLGAVLEIFLVKNKTVSIYHQPCINASIGGGQSLAL
jgi:hypothetical protein